MRIYLVIFLGFFCAVSSFSEDLPQPKSLKILKQKGPKILEPLAPQADVSEEDSEQKTSSHSGLASSSLSILAYTAALDEDDFNRPFKSLGSFFLISLPLTRIAKPFWLHLEGGLGLTYAKVVLAQPDTGFSRLEFPIPLTLRGLWSVSRVLTLDFFGGINYRPLFYDSRDNTSGGFQAFSENQFKIDGGLGFRFRLSPTSRLRLRASYSYIGAGVEFIL